MARGKMGSRPASLRRGDLVRVRPLKEILGTLGEDGKCEGLPFMPEMVAHCGREFRVYRRADKILHDRSYYMGRLYGTVLLEGLRCDGAAHGGCTAGCLLLWKEAWLEPAGAPRTPSVEDQEPGPESAPLTTVKEGRFFCQATELVAATTYLPWWDPRQYVRDVLIGEASLKEIFVEVSLLAYNRLARMFGRRPYGALVGHQTTTASCELNLQPGELVEVKSRAEIEATLDSEGKNRGLGFAPDMSRYCGRRFRVGRRVDRMILEWSGEMRPLSHTVTLESVICQGIGLRRCPRSCHHLWREIWLKRVTDDTPVATSPRSALS